MEQKAENWKESIKHFYLEPESIVKVIKKKNVSKSKETETEELRQLYIKCCGDSEEEGSLILPNVEFAFHNSKAIRKVLNDYKEVDIDIIVTDTICFPWASILFTPPPRYFGPEKYFDVDGWKCTDALGFDILRVYNGIRHYLKMFLLSVVENLKKENALEKAKLAIDPMYFYTISLTRLNHDLIGLSYSIESHSINNLKDNTLACVLESTMNYWLMNYEFFFAKCSVLLSHLIPLLENERIIEKGHPLFESSPQYKDDPEKRILEIEDLSNSKTLVEQFFDAHLFSDAHLFLERCPERFFSSFVKVCEKVKGEDDPRKNVLGEFFVKNTSFFKKYITKSTSEPSPSVDVTEKEEEEEEEETVKEKEVPNNKRKERDTFANKEYDTSKEEEEDNEEDEKIYPKIEFKYPEEHLNCHPQGRKMTKNMEKFTDLRAKQEEESKLSSSNSDEQMEKKEELPLYNQLYNKYLRELLDREGDNPNLTDDYIQKVVEQDIHDFYWKKRKQQRSIKYFNRLASKSKETGQDNSTDPDDLTDWTCQCFHCKRDRDESGIISEESELSDSDDDDEQIEKEVVNPPELPNSQEPKQTEEEEEDSPPPKMVDGYIVAIADKDNIPIIVPNLETLEQDFKKLKEENPEYKEIYETFYNKFYYLIRQKLIDEFDFVEDHPDLESMIQISMHVTYLRYENEDLGQDSKCQCTLCKQGVNTERKKLNILIPKLENGEIKYIYLPIS